MDERLGLVHFVGSFVTMNAIFLPMFLMGLMGVNRRLYDGGLQDELASRHWRGIRTSPGARWLWASCSLCSCGTCVWSASQARQPRSGAPPGRVGDHVAAAAGQLRRAAGRDRAPRPLR